MATGPIILEAYKNGDIIDSEGCLTEVGKTLKNNMIEYKQNKVREHYGTSLPSRNHYHNEAYYYLKEYSGNDEFNDVALLFNTMFQFAIGGLNSRENLQLYIYVFTSNSISRHAIPFIISTHFFNPPVVDSGGGVKALLMSDILQKIHDFINSGLGEDFLSDHKLIVSYTACRVYKGEESPELSRTISKNTDKSIHCFLKGSERLELKEVLSNNEIDTMKDLYDRLGKEMLALWQSKKNQRERIELLDKLLQEKNLSVSVSLLEDGHLKEVLKKTYKVKLIDSFHSLKDKIVESINEAREIEAALETETNISDYYYIYENIRADETLFEPPDLSQRMQRKRGPDHDVLFGCLNLHNDIERLLEETELSFKIIHDSEYAYLEDNPTKFYYNNHEIDPDFIF